MITYILRNLKNWLETIYNGSMKCFLFHPHSATVIDITIIANGMPKILDYINNVLSVTSTSTLDVHKENISLCCHIMSFWNKEIFDFKLYVAMATGQGDGQAGVWHLQLWGRPSHAGLHWQNLQKPHSCLHDQSKITLMGKVSIRYRRFKEKSQTNKKYTTGEILNT